MFSLQSWTKADDIRDFEIEGISIGDSLLDIFSKTDIDSIEPIYYPKSKKFHDLPIISSKFKTYDQVTFGLKENDKNYIIYSLAGNLYYENDFTNCLKKKKEIVKEINFLFTDQIRSDYKQYFENIDDGKSFSEITDFKFKDNSLLRVYCTDWTPETEKKRDFYDMLSIDASSAEYMTWLDKVAY